MFLIGAVGLASPSSPHPPLTILFAFLAPVHWPAVLALGIGCLIGSRLGPIVVRHAPAAPLRAVIGVAGLALAVKLGIDAYV